MASSTQPARGWNDPLLRAIAAVAAALALAFAALYLFGNAGRRLFLILGVVQAASAAAAVEAIAVAFVALSRYRVLPEPMPFWIGLTASVSAVGGLVFTASFPSLVPPGPGTIAELPSTSAWVAYITYVEMAILLLLAAKAPWPRPGRLAERWWFLFVIATVTAATGIQAAVVVFERALPAIATASGEIPWQVLLYFPVVILSCIGAVLFAQRYRCSGDVLAGYASLAELLLAGQYAALAISNVRLDIAYYAALALLFGAPTVLLYGLLSDYAGHYRREKEATEEARRRAREAEEAVHARDLFLETAAHELKTPITNLRGFAQTVVRQLERQETPDRERTLRAMNTIDRQSDRLARLEQQLLDVADIESDQFRLHRQETDLVPMLRELVANVQAVSKRHTLDLQAPPSLPAFVDPLRFEQVMANLLDNAVKFGRPETPVEIELSTPEPALVRLCVRDHGPGIPAEARSQLFRPYFQAQGERPFAGLGLGLYYSRAIVELHGGTLTAEFPPDGGSRFVVTLPRGL